MVKKDYSKISSSILTVFNKTIEKLGDLNSKINSEKSENFAVIKELQTRNIELDSVFEKNKRVLSKIKTLVE